MKMLNEKQINELEGGLRPKWAYPIGAMLDTLKLLMRENKRLKTEYTELKDDFMALSKRFKDALAELKEKI